MVGLVIVIVFGLLLWRYHATLISYGRQNGRHRAFAVMMASAMIALVVHGLVDVPYFKNDLAMLFWLLLALPTSAAAYF